MNHKRKRPKHKRDGCLMCKPWKGRGSNGEEMRPLDVRREPSLEEEMAMWQEAGRRALETTLREVEGP